MTKLLEVMPELFTRSEILPLYFADITAADKHKNIQAYIRQQEQLNLDPRSAKSRQKFNEEALSQTNSRYLIGRYGENRVNILSKDSHMVQQGRTYHLGVDVFSRNLETIHAPCDGKVVVSAYEPGEHNYGNYLIFRPDDLSLPYFFFGHLANSNFATGRVQAGEQIAMLGSYENLENGGWSIHLHLQLLQNLPPKGDTPIGYSTLEDLSVNQVHFPEPQSVFPAWKIQR